MKKITLILIAFIALTGCEDRSTRGLKNRLFVTHTKNTRRFHFEEGSKIETFGADWELITGEDGHNYLTSTASVMHYIDCKLCISRTKLINKRNVTTNYVTLIPDTFKDNRALWQK